MTQPPNRSLNHYHHTLRTCNYTTAKNSTNTYIQALYQNRIGTFKKLAWIKHKLDHTKNRPENFQQLCKFVMQEINCNKRTSQDYANTLRLLNIHKPKQRKEKETLAEQNLTDFMNY